MKIKQVCKRITLLLGGLVPALGCLYDPTFPNGILCSAEGECPNGQVCAIDNRCYAPSEVPPLNRDASLTSLAVSEGSLVPAFDPSVMTYQVNLGLGVESLSLVPTATVPGKTTILVNGDSVESGEQTTPVDLGLGSNQIEILTTAQDGSSITYTVAVDRGIEIAQVAYTKASNTDSGDNFGFRVDLSGDTLVVGAPAEDSIANGINGLQTNNTSIDSGAVYVFIRSGEVWEQQAYIKASNSEADDAFGSSVAIDGNTLVVGAPNEDSSATTVGGSEADNSADNAGAAYVFLRVGEIWSQQAYIKPSNGEAADQFGTSVAIDTDTLVVGAPLEDSSSPGINSNQADNSASGAGAVYVFQRMGASWSQQAYVKSSNPDADDRFGGSVALSGDLLAVGAFNEDSSTTGIDGNESDNSAPGAGAVYTFVRSGSNWQQESYIKASNSDPGDHFGISAALTDTLLAVGANREDSNSVGIDGDESDNSASRAGAAYLFDRDGSSWTQSAYIKPTNTDANDGFGGSLAIAQDLVVVGASDEASSGRGPNSDQSDNASPETGAVYIFLRQGTEWSQRTYLKASNSDVSDNFGISVAATTESVAIGAFGEASSATGIGGSQNNNGASDAGAVYIFR